MLTTLSFSTDDPEQIFRTADQLMHHLLFEEDLFGRGEVLRLVGVSAARLTNEKEEYRQLSLFDLPPGETEQEKARKKRDAALKDMMERINSRFGDKAVRKGT